MNREIKFKVWDYQNNQWAKEYQVMPSIGFEFGTNDYFINIAGEKALRWGFCQYIGLKDKNGKEIYEGDVVKGRYTPKVVDELISFNLYVYDNHQWFSEVEVIGNIYENPELINHQIPSTT